MGSAFGFTAFDARLSSDVVSWKPRSLSGSQGKGDNLPFKILYLSLKTQNHPSQIIHKIA